MRIVVTADTVGGVWTYARELVTGLVRNGFDVILVSFGNIPSSEQIQWMDGLPRLDYRPTAFKLEWMQDSENDLRASAEYLEAVVEETSPDLLHLNQFYYGALECPMPRFVVAHSDVVSWWVAVHGCEPPDSAWMRWYRGIVQRGITNATAVVAPSRWMLDQIGRYYAQPERTAVIYNGRTSSLFHSDNTKENLITTVGRVWDTGKNTALLLKGKMPWPVCIVGSDTQPGSEAGIAEHYKSAPGVQFLRPQNEKELSGLLGRTAIYTAVSRYEPFGLAPVEAALSGCAVVASNIESFREIWGNAAVFFRNNDAESLGDALSRLTEDPAFRQICANRACDHARRWFSAERMVEQYANLYRELLPEKNDLRVQRDASVIQAEQG